MILNSLLIDTYVIVRPSGSKSSTGAYQTTGSNYSSGSCRIEPISVDKVIRNDKDEVIANYKMFCNPDSNLQETDSLLISGSYYSINGISNYFNKHYEITLLQL